MDYYEIDQKFDEISDYEIYEPSGAEIWATCVWPSLQQIFNYTIPFFICILTFRITTQTCKLNFFHSAKHLVIVIFNKKKHIFQIETNSCDQLSSKFHSSRYTSTIPASFIHHLWLSTLIFHAWLRFRVQFMLYID